MNYNFQGPYRWRIDCVDQRLKITNLFTKLQIYHWDTINMEQVSQIQSVLDECWDHIRLVKPGEYFEYDIEGIQSKLYNIVSNEL